jgi:PAS domain S-box-containing protein
MRILIVDDHELVRSGVRSVLASRRDFDVCGEAVDGQDAIEKARQLNPDLVVMDVSMPKVNGIEATREIQRLMPQTAVLILSQHNSPEMMRQALNAGARGYVVKSAIAANLVSGIDKVRSGELFFDSNSIKLPEKNADKNLDLKEILKRSEAFERALRESEERFRLTFEEAAVGMAHVSSDARCLRVNRRLCEILGYTQEELQKLTFLEITHPADLPRCLTQLKRLEAGEIEQYVDEKRYIRKDGELVWAKLSAAPVRGSDGAVKYLISIVEDISSQKLAEARLLASEDRLRNLLDFQTAAMTNMAEGLYTLDEFGRVTSINPAAETVFGWTSAELIGKKMHDVSHYKHLNGTPYPSSGCPILEVLQSGYAIREREDFFVRKDGSFMPVVYSASPLRRDGKVAGVVVGFRDDSEQRLVRSALQASERQLRETLDALPVAVYTTDAHGRLTHYNPAAVEFSGEEPELGSDNWCSSWKFYKADGTVLPHEECPMNIALRGEQIEDGVEIAAERADGTKRSFKLYPRPIRDAERRIIGCVNMLVDVTGQRRAQEATSLLAAIVDSSGDAIVSKTLEGVITSWNRSAERLFGYSAVEAIGKNMMMLVPPERREEEIAILERIGRGERINHFETVRRHKNGTLLELSVSISPIKDLTGRVIGASNVSRDISDRKRAEKSLAETARQQKALFHLADHLHRAVSMEDIYESALDAIFEALLCDRASIFLADNEGRLRFTRGRGLSDAFLQAVDGHSVWSPNDPNPQPVRIENVQRADAGNALHAALKSEGIQALAFIPLVSDGRLIGKFMMYFNSPHVFSDKEMDLSLTIARTLASGIERKRSEEARVKSDERLRSMAESLDAQVRTRTAELEMRSAEVYEQSERLRDLSARLLQAQDDERRRIARELHDSVGQFLTVLGLNIASLAMHSPALPPDAAKTVEQSERLLDQLNREIRTMSYLLHPPLLDESGLAEALRWYISGLQQRSNIDIDLEVAPDFGRLAPDTELIIFRIVQEALTNIHRHSRSEMALIRLVRSDDTISVEIQDWGTGIPPEKLKIIQSHGSGVGIRGMRERVRQLHGDLTIESDADGTRVRVTFPASIAINETPYREKYVAS